MRRTLRIVHLITDLDVGGAEMSLARLVEASDPSRFQNVVVSLQDGGVIAERIARAGVPVSGLGMRRGGLNPRGFWRLTRLLRRVRPDVLQTWLYHADLAGLVASAMVPGPQLVWNIRCSELDPPEHSWMLMRTLPILAAFSGRPAAVVCNSIAGRRAHAGIGYRPRRWEVIPNGFDTETFCPSLSARKEVRSELGVEDATLLVGVVARVHPMKDHGTFFRAAAIVAQKRSDVQFLIAGRGTDSTRSIADSIKKLGIDRRVHLVGERTDTPRLLAAVDCVVSSASSEGFPNVVGEAMACGTPCVVTDVGDSAVLVGSAGIVVAPRDPGALANGIMRVIAMDSGQRRVMGMAARERIQTDYSMLRTAERYHALYDEITRTK